MAFGPFGRGLKPVTKEQEDAFSKGLAENNVGLKDGFAMVLSAFIFIVLPCLLVLGLLSLLALALFGAF